MKSFGAARLPTLPTPRMGARIEAPTSFRPRRGILRDVRGPRKALPARAGDGGALPPVHPEPAALDRADGRVPVPARGPERVMPRGAGRQADGRAARGA